MFFCIFLLQENSSHGLIAGIGVNFQLSFSATIKQCQYRRGRDQLLQVIKRRILYLAPCKWYILACKVIQKGRNL